MTKDQEDALLDDPSPAITYSGQFCWCDMCGYTARVELKDVPDIEAQADCPECKSENMFSILQIGTEIPEHVAESDPMPTYPAV